MFPRFAVIQDAGTAITGPSRIDVFWGAGSTAEAIAGDMRNPGSCTSCYHSRVRGPAADVIHAVRYTAAACLKDLALENRTPPSVRTRSNVGVISDPTGSGP